MSYGHGVRIASAATAILWLATAAHAQTDAEYVARAREIIALVGERPPDRVSAIARDFVPGVTVVHLDDMFNVGLDRELRVSGYTDERRVVHPENAARVLRTDADAYSKAEEYVRRFDGPEGLTRARIRWTPRSTYVAAGVLCTLRLRPHGYESEVGASVELDPVNGKLRSIYITRIWSFEPPNVQVSEAQAKEIASRNAGGSPADWRAIPRYTSGVKPDFPEYMQEMARNRVQRICWWVDRRGDNPWLVRIDSVTGTVLDSRSARTTSTTIPSAEGKNVSKTNSPGTAPTNFPIRQALTIAAVLAALGVVWLLFRRRVG